MAARTRDLVVVGGLALLALAAQLWLPATLGTGVLGALLVLLLPGYAVAGLLGVQRLDAGLRPLLTVAVSLAITCLASLAVAAAGVPLDRLVWTAALAVVTVVGCLVQGVVRRTATLAETTAPWSLPRLGYVPVLGVALGLAALSWGVATVGASTENQSRFTQLWLVPNPGSDTAVAGIRNVEGRPVTYRLEVRAGSRTLQSWPEIQLPANGAWEAAIDLSSAGGAQVEGALYRTDQPANVYRRVHLTR